MTMGSRAVKVILANARLLSSQVLCRARVVSSIHKQHLVKHIEGFASEIGYRTLTLDIGSGNAPYKRFFHTHQYMTVDLSASHEVSARGDTCALPFRASAADIVVCTEVMEHVEDVDRALEEVNRVLRNGGYLVLTTPLLMGMHCAVDYCRFTETMLRILLERHGFRILRLEKRGGILSVLGAVLLQIPLQTLGLHENGSSPKRRYLLVALAYVFLVPLAKGLVLLDVLDRTRNFTLGYDCLCRKEPG